MKMKEHERIIEELVHLQRIVSPEDWYRVKKRDLDTLERSKELFSEYGGRICNVLLVLYNEYAWYPWRFEKVPPDYWEDQQNQESYVEWVSKELHITDHTQWYGVSPDQLFNRHGSTILDRHHYSTYSLLSTVYPNTHWHPWLFDKVPAHYWEEIENCIKFLEWLAEKLELRTPDGWYKVKVREVDSNGGAGLLNRYEESLYGLLSDVYSECVWHPWLFDSSRGASFLLPLPPLIHDILVGFWTELENHRVFCEWLAHQFSIELPDQWYKIQRADVIALGGAYLFGKSSSVVSALSYLYPEYLWQPWRFTKAPHRFWSLKENLDEYIGWLSDQLPVNSIADVYNISADEITALHGSMMLSKYGLYDLLCKCFPNYSLDKQLIERTHGKHQGTLLRSVKQLLSHVDTKEIWVDFKHPQLNYPKSRNKSNIELDMYLPTVGLAFEYQGQQHYQWDFRCGSPSVQQQRDKDKAIACTRAGITLISVPCWWDQQISSLQTMIHQYRPDLLRNTG